MTRKANNPAQSWGLELGGSAVRLVRLTRSGESYRADGYWEVPLEDRWAAAPSLESALARLGAQVKVTGPLGVSVPDEWVLHRVLVLPLADPATTAKMVANQMDLLLPAQVEAFAWSWGQVADPFQADKTRVLLCAARKEALGVLTRCAAALGQAPSVAMPSGLALATAWPLLHGRGDSLLLVDVAARSTALIVLHQGRPLRCAVVDEGGDHWTHRLAELEGLAPQEAEAVKLDAGSAQGLPRSLSSHVAQCLREEMTRWADELREAYADCVADIPRPQRPDRCVLLGRAALTEGLVGLVGETLNMPAGLAGLPPLLSLDSRGPAAARRGVAFDQAAGAISAAVAAMQEAPALVNLAPAPPRVRAVLARPGWRWAAAVVWLLAAVAGLYALDLHHAAGLRETVAQVQGRLGGGGQLGLNRAIGQYLEQGAPPPLEVLAEVSSLAPDQAVLTSWRYNRKGEIAVIGIVPNEAELQGFLKKLSDSSLVGRVEPGVAKIERDRLTFEITFTTYASRRASTSQPTTGPSSQPAASVGADEASSQRGFDRGDGSSRRTRRRRSELERPGAAVQAPPAEPTGPSGPVPAPSPPYGPPAESAAPQEPQAPQEQPTPPGLPPEEPPASQPAEGQEP